MVRQYPCQVLVDFAPADIPSNRSVKLIKSSHVLGGRLRQLSQKKATTGVVSFSYTDCNRVWTELGYNSEQIVAWRVYETMPSTFGTAKDAGQVEVNPVLLDKDSETVVWVQWSMVGSSASTMLRKFKLSNSFSYRLAAAKYCK